MEGIVFLTTTGGYRMTAETKSDKERMRRVIAKWFRQGGDRSWQVVEELGSLARERKGVPRELIISEYRRMQEKPV